MLEEAWSVDKIRQVLLEKDDAVVTIVQRMMAIFYARFHDTPEAVEVLTSALWHDSVLLRHEIAYILGQMNQPSALDTLITLCDNVHEHPMVRHEAGEALNALGITTDRVFECVQRNLQDPSQPVRETFELAFIGLKRKLERGGGRLRADPSKGFYLFTASARRDEECDFTPTQPDTPEAGAVIQAPAEFATTKDPAEGDLVRQRPECTAELGRILRDESAPLWDRYVALFTLRNINTAAAAWELALGLDEKSSALLRHEICFVLGQMQLPISLEKLIERVEDLKEASMARHEAALALGSVGANVWSKVGRAARLRALEILEKYQSDPDPIVAESCEVALHNIEWETGVKNGEQRTLTQECK